MKSKQYVFKINRNSLSELRDEKDNSFKVKRKPFVRVEVKESDFGFLQR